MNFETHGQGPKLLLLHGLGGNARSWTPLLPLLAPHHELIIPDLPGFGQTPLPQAPLGIEVLADAVEAFLDSHGLRGGAVCGHSMGGAVALELFRRGATGATVALAPGGFWMGWERSYIAGHVGMGLLSARAARPLLPLAATLPPTRTLLFSLFSSRPWDIAPELALAEALSVANSPGCDPMVAQILAGPLQKGLEAPRPVPLAIGWGRLDRLTLVQQAPRAVAAFPGSTLHWLGEGGHYVHWDEPEAAARLIIDTCAGAAPRITAAAPGLAASGPDAPRHDALGSDGADPGVATPPAPIVLSSETTGSDTAALHGAASGGADPAATRTDVPEGRRSAA